MLRRLPAIHDVVIWNEANNPFFWPTAAGGAGYEAPLADAWDRLHFVPPTQSTQLAAAIELASCQPDVGAKDAIAAVDAGAVDCSGK